MTVENRDQIQPLVVYRIHQLDHQAMKLGKKCTKNKPIMEKLTFNIIQNPKHNSTWEWPNAKTVPSQSGFSIYGRDRYVEAQYIPSQITDWESYMEIIFKADLSKLNVFAAEAHDT